MILDELKYAFEVDVPKCEGESYQTSSMAGIGKVLTK